MQESAERLNNQAIELTTMGSFTEAVACYKRALTLEKDNYLLWFNLGVTYQKQGDTAGAKHAFKTAFNLNDCDQEVIEQLSITCLEQKNFEESLEYCQTGLDLNPLNANLWNTLGVIFFNSGEYDLASEAFERAVSINPYYYDALFNLRDTYAELKNKAGEAECAERLSKLKAPEEEI